jgi:hypothetical protein
VVRVKLTDEKYRPLRHPNGVGFLPGLDTAEWPFDIYTKRVIEDGAITVEQAPSAEQHEPATRSKKS